MDWMRTAVEETASGASGSSETGSATWFFAAPMDRSKVTTLAWSLTSLAMLSRYLVRSSASVAGTLALGSTTSMACRPQAAGGPCSCAPSQWRILLPRTYSAKSLSAEILMLRAVFVSRMFECSSTTPGALKGACFTSSLMGWYRLIVQFLAVSRACMGMVNFNRVSSWGFTSGGGAPLAGLPAGAAGAASLMETTLTINEALERPFMTSSLRSMKVDRRNWLLKPLMYV